MSNGIDALVLTIGVRKKSEVYTVKFPITRQQEFAQLRHCINSLLSYLLCQNISHLSGMEGGKCSSVLFWALSTSSTQPYLTADPQRTLLFHLLTSSIKHSSLVECLYTVVLRSTTTSKWQQHLAGRTTWRLLTSSRSLRTCQRTRRASLHPLSLPLPAPAASANLPVS